MLFDNKPFIVRPSFPSQSDREQRWSGDLEREWKEGVALSASKAASQSN